MTPKQDLETKFQEDDTDSHQDTDDVQRKPMPPKRLQCPPNRSSGNNHKSHKSHKNHIKGSPGTP